jgi:hypothetical protein
VLPLRSNLSAHCDVSQIRDTALGRDAENQLAVAFDDAGNAAI